MIELAGVAVRQGDFRIDGWSLAVPTGAYAVLTGPSGCGKTTLLESVCGLRRLQAGRVRLGGVDVTDLPPAARGIGYLPQEAVLFDHMSVARHLTLGLEYRGAGRRERRRAAGLWAERLGLESLLRRRPHGLSGGERRRVALGRALSWRPRALLLDEPLAGLDAAAAARVAKVLRRLHAEDGFTALHVTHDEAEAAALATAQFTLASSGELHRTS